MPTINMDEQHKLAGEGHTRDVYIMETAVCVDRNGTFCSKRRIYDCACTHTLARMNGMDGLYRDGWRNEIIR